MIYNLQKFFTDDELLRVINLYRKYGNWCKQTQKHKIKGKVLDYIEKMDVENNTDIADLFLSDNRKHFIKEFMEYINSIGQVGLAK